MSTEEPLNLEPLGESYEVIGELAGREDARSFMARRRSDGLDVLIVVARTPSGDQGNALSHLAADAHLLSSAAHPSLLPIVEGKWIGTDAFALVMRRTQAPTLHELLSRREEEFGFPRIATILRETNAVLEWAREQRVVHRAVTPGTLFVESGSDRVHVAFAISPLQASGIPGADADGKSIAGLARAMFTRSPAAPERADRPLAELRPGLPMLLIDETDALLQAPRTTDVPDVTGYIARIAMAEALKSGEVHLEQTRDTIKEQQHAHHEQLEMERREHEQQLAAERKEHEHQVTDQAKKFAKEREEFERELAKERKALAKEHEALAKERAAHARDQEALVRERAAHARDREELAKERAAHARDRAALLEERATYERLTKEQRKRLALQAAALQTQARLYAQAAEREAVHTSGQLSSPVAAIPGVEAAVHTLRLETAPTRSGPTRWNRVQSKRLHWNHSWNVPAAAVALVLLVGFSVSLAIGGSRGPATFAATTRAPAMRIVDSAGGAVAVYQSIVPLPEVTTDTARLAAIASDWTPPPRRRPRPMPAVRTDTVFLQRDTVGRLILPSPARRDSVLGVDTLPKRDTTFSASDGIRREARPRN